MPEFPGGDLALRKFLANSVKYPEIAQENGVQGKVFVNFVVDTNGGISNVKVARGVDASLDKEAIRVVRSMPKWIPGKQGGQAVRVSFTVPINFVLQ
jgi:protein TonB